MQCAVTQAGSRGAAERAVGRRHCCALRIRIVPSALPSPFHVLYEDDHLVAIDKPRAFYVHPPEDGWPCPVEENALYLLKRQLGPGAWLWPIHRIDRATSGVTVYCKTEAAASALGEHMRERRVQKSYIALTRGFTDTYGCIDTPLGGAPSRTLYETLARCELPLQVSKWPSSRYSLIRAEPLTGRYHQIRRHLNYVSHPIVGDGDHGDRHHNRAFAGQLGLPHLFLRAASIRFPHPATGQLLRISVDQWDGRWQTVFGMMGLCPHVPPTLLAMDGGQDQGSLLLQHVRLAGVLALEPGGLSAGAADALARDTLLRQEPTPHTAALPYVEPQQLPQLAPSLPNSV